MFYSQIKKTNKTPDTLFCNGGVQEILFFLLGYTIVHIHYKNTW